MATATRGPDTGGMGAYCPLPWLEEGFADDVIDRFVHPTLAELRRRGIDYRGVLYTGLMVTEDGPKLVEFNVRFGDPDSQVVLLRLTADLAALSAAAADGRLGEEPISDGSSAVLVGRRPRATPPPFGGATGSTVWRPPVGSTALRCSALASPPTTLAT